MTNPNGSSRGAPPRLADNCSVQIQVSHSEWHIESSREGVLHRISDSGGVQEERLILNSTDPWRASQVVNRLLIDGVSRQFESLANRLRAAIDNPVSFLIVDIRHDSMQVKTSTLTTDIAHQLVRPKPFTLADGHRAVENMTYDFETLRWAWDHLQELYKELGL